MKKLSLVFGTVNSRPAGTADEELEDIYQRAYKPFLSTAYNYPEISLTLYYSGTLLTWLEQNHAEFTDVINEMVARRQVELLGGGFHDPVLPLIPRPDRLGQVESLTTLLRKRFGRRPRGSWITEQLWEPFLASTLKNSGMEYTLLDDYHFVVAGLGGMALREPCITEDQGKTLGVFPLSHYHSRRFFEQEPQDLLADLRDSAGKGGVLSIVVDGELLASGSSGAERGGAESRLKRFFDAVRGASEWLEPVLPTRYLRANPPRRRAYFAATSFRQMNGWSGEGIPNDHVQGGFFRQLLTRYAESNLMYAKMQYAHILVNQIRGDKYRKQTAREELWKGQCHAAYWHGRQAGIYRNHLRKNVYTSLIESEKITREKGIFIPSIIGVDFDMDGLGEYLFQGHEMNAYVHREGGKLIELDYLPTSWNYLDAFGRYPEEYHEDGVRSAGYDNYLRRAAIDHFYLHDESLERFASCTAEERGDFVTRIYDVDSVHREHHEVRLSAQGSVDLGGGPLAVRIQKGYGFKSSSLTIDYRVENGSSAVLDCCFGVEFCLGFLSDKPEHLAVSYKPSGGTRQVLEPGVTGAFESLDAVDRINNVSLSLQPSRPAELWHLPIRTVDVSDEGRTERYQGTCFVPRWRLHLNPGESFEMRLALSMNKA